MEEAEEEEEEEEERRERKAPSQGPSRARRGAPSPAAAHRATTLRHDLAQKRRGAAAHQREGQ